MTRRADCFRNLILISAAFIQTSLCTFLLDGECIAQNYVKVQPTKYNPIRFNEVTPQFGGVEVGEQSLHKVISITNVSRDPIFLLQIQATDDFEENDLCSEWLAEGSTCLLYITFVPREGGARTGRLYVDGAKANVLGVWVESSFSQSIPLEGFGMPEAAANDGPADSSKGSAIRTTNNEESADFLYHSQKPYTHQDIVQRIPTAFNRAIDDEKRLFALTDDTVLKLETASFLLSVGVKDSVYMEYLGDEARKSLAHDHDIPWPFLYEQVDSGKESVNPAFVAWCKNRRLAFWEIEEALQYPRPDTWYYLGAAGDIRFYDLLVQGLHSGNIVTAGNAARGLAKLGDQRAIDELIAVGRMSPAGVRLFIVESLIYFPDAKAQNAAVELTPEDSRDLLDMYRSEMKEKGIRALFMW